MVIQDRFLHDVRSVTGVQQIVMLLFTQHDSPPCNHAALKGRWNLKNVVVNGDNYYTGDEDKAISS